MSSTPVTVIACDIGGVVKNQLTDGPIENSIESIIKLSENTANRVIFISKCKDKYKEKSTKWLQEHNLSHIKTYYCLEYDEKIKIANENNVHVMIDDRMQVLQTFPSTIVKIWFCSDKKKIEGAQKYQPDFVNSVRLARDWYEILELIEQLHAE